MNRAHDPMQSYERIPIIRLWKVLLVPLQGDVTDTLADRLTEEVLARVHAEEVAGLVIDVTGLWLVDSHLCAVLSRLAEATALVLDGQIEGGAKRGPFAAPADEALAGAPPDQLLHRGNRRLRAAHANSSGLPRCFTVFRQRRVSL